jgi:ankyrin repeat protein
MTKYLLPVLFILLNFHILNAQGQETQKQEEKLSKTDSLSVLLYKNIIRDAKTKPSVLIPKIEQLIAEGAEPNRLLIFTGTYRKPMTYIPIIKDFYKEKYKKYVIKTTAFHAAVESGDTNVVAKLIESGAKPDIPARKNDYPVKIASENQDINMVLFLLDKGADIEHVNLSDFEDINAIRQLIKYGANVEDINWNFALEDTNKLKKLIAINPEFKGVRLDFEKLFANNQIFDFLMEHGLPVSAYNSDSFMDCPLVFGAVKYNNLYALKKIMATGKVDINDECSGYFRRTVLTVAIDEEHPQILDYLLKHGANPMQKDWTGKVAINQTIFCDDPKPLMQLLIKAGADIEYSGYFNKTPLMNAVSLNKYIAALSLIELGANVNAKNKYGESPLSYAIDSKSLPLLKLLIENGADPKTTIKGLSLSEYAQKKGTPGTIIEYLNSL